MADNTRPEKDWLGHDTGRTEHLNEKGEATGTTEQARHWLTGHPTDTQIHRDRQGNVKNTSDVVEGGFFDDYDKRQVFKDSSGRVVAENIYRGGRTEHRDYRPGQTGQTSGGGEGLSWSAVYYSRRFASTVKSVVRAVLWFLVAMVVLFLLIRLATALLVSVSGVG